MSLKKLSVWMLALVIMLTPVALSAGTWVRPAEAQEGTGDRTITVTGYGIAYGAPDIVRVGLGVESVNTDIMAAMDDASARMQAVIQALQDGGVAAEDIRTDYFSIYQDYGYAGPAPADGGAPTPAYRVSTSVTAIVRDTETVGELLAAAVSAGANIVNYLQFDIEDRSALESEARADAISDAQARAAEIASSLGLTVGEPIRVVEGVDAVPLTDIRGLGGGGGAGAAAVPISEGQLSVNMAVTITFAVQ
jgi:uncharacterized protein YggE